MVNPTLRLVVRFPIPRGAIVALIGPSGSGKSTLIRCLTRLNDLVPGCRVEGEQSPVDGAQVEPRCAE